MAGLTARAAGVTSVGVLSLLLSEMSRARQLSLASFVLQRPAAAAAAGSMLLFGEGSFLTKRIFPKPEIVSIYSVETVM